MRGWPLRRARFALPLALMLIGAVIPAAGAAEAPPTRLIDVVAVTWPDAPAATVSTDELEAVIRHDTIERWQTISAGRIVFTFDAVLPAVRMPRAMPCDAAGSVRFLSDVALAAYNAAAITKYDHRYLVVLAPDPGNCLWDGRGVVNPPGSTSGLLLLKDNADRMVIAHELGHNLGLGHSNLERCLSGRPDGEWKGCRAVEYGSSLDIMGTQLRQSPLSAYHQWRMGWIADGDVAVGNRGLSVQLQPVSSDTGTRAVFLRDRTAAYWIEYRLADPEAAVSEGLVIHRTDQPPSTSVENPLGAAEIDAASTALTRDVWLINLGDYVYGEQPQGSPALSIGISFTTAYGGATVSARASAAGSVQVSVTRTGDTAPAAPTWTDPSSWRDPSAPVIAADLDDRGVDIARYEGRLVSAGATRTVAFRPTTVAKDRRTYLNPIADPGVVTAGALPEGSYTLQLRAVNITGTRGPWSAVRRVHIDRGVPTVVPNFTSRPAPAGAVAIVWHGVRDAGSGICAARITNTEGFVLAGWQSARPGVPRFVIPAATALRGTAEVFDCLGNGVRGSIALRAANGSQRVTGSWKPVSTAVAAVRARDASLANPTQRALARLGFAQSDFSDTQTVGLMTDGDTLTVPTLDLCAGAFASEVLRVARRQVIVSNTDAGYRFVSTETVRYASAAAARQALRELDAAASACRIRGYADSADGTREPYAFLELPALPAGLRPVADRRIYAATAGESTTASTMLLAYQFKGRTLNALYVVKRGAASMDAAAIRRWLQVAAVLAGRLTRLGQ